ncbi:MAG: D-aminoacyl-tRNA deacylase [Candidatus Cloacimonadales bacterium]
MKLVIQRVSSASVRVNNELVSEIKQGLLVLIGVSPKDTSENIDWLVNKLINLRIFEDDNGKMNLSVQDINGEIMLISQFTLYANCEKGRRPSFIEAGEPEMANRLYEEFCAKVQTSFKEPRKGIFGADMKIALVNDGPVTIILEK